MLMSRRSERSTATPAKRVCHSSAPARRECRRERRAAPPVVPAGAAQRRGAGGLPERVVAVLCRPLRFWGPAAPGHGPCLPGHPAGVVEGASQQHLDLGVEAAKLVGGPSGQGVVDSWVDAQQHLFALTAHV
jgi:hypothetical protein